MSRPLAPRILGTLALCWSSLLPACALLSKAEPLSTRYFTPQYAAPSETQVTPATHSPQPLPTASALSLRLGLVSAASNLRERMAYRPSEHEIAYYETRRWSERPGSYLEHALSRSLFERHGLTMVVSGSAPTLGVELKRFEEIVQKPHRVRVEVTMVLQHDKIAQFHETVRIEQKVAEVDPEQAPEAVVHAFSLALQAVVERVAERSVQTLKAIDAREAADSSQSPRPTGAATGSAR